MRVLILLHDIHRRLHVMFVSLHINFMFVHTHIETGRARAFTLFGSVQTNYFPAKFIGNEDTLCITQTYSIYNLYDRVVDHHTG